MDTHRPTPAPARGEGAPSFACFAATAPAGPLLLEVAGDIRHAADAAIALHRCDPLLRALHAWTGVAHEWHWIDARSWRPTAGSHAAARWRTDAVAHAQVELPWALVRGLPRPADDVAALLDWPVLPAVLAVSRLGLTVEELNLMERGGAVLLPESFSPSWHGLLRAADEPCDAGVPVDLASPAAPRLARATERPATDEAGDLRIGCEVRLGSVHALSADCLGGWCDALALDGVGAQAQLWRRGGAGTPAQRLASGRLMPWGHGWALALEHVEDLDGTVPFIA
jgi:hypothetical protein